MATVLLNSTKSQPRNLYLSTIDQLFPPNPKSNLSQRTKTHRDRCSSHLNTFDDILRLNGYPENSIEQTKPRTKPSTCQHRMVIHVPYISERLNHRITNIFRKENIPVRIAHKSYTLRRALTLTSTKRKCTRDKRPTPDCVYEEMQCTSSRVTAAINNTLIARHASSTTALKNISIMKDPLWKNISFPARTKTIKALRSILLRAKTTPLIYAFMKHFTLESASLHSIPGRNVVNSQTFYFSILETILKRF